MRISDEKLLTRQLGKLVDRIIVAIDPSSEDCAEDGEVLFGASTIVAYTDRSKAPPVYSPETAFVQGNCDFVFRFGDRTADYRGKDLAVFELKKFRVPRVTHYHFFNNSICAQIHCSFVGSEAPLGVILGNGVCKFFWKKLHAKDVYRFYTFPAGNDMLDLTEAAGREKFMKVMYHVVRCSLLNVTKETREGLPVSKRVKLEDTTEKFHDVFGSAEAADLTEVAKSSEELFKNCPPTTKRAFFVQTVSGEIVQLTALDYIGWTKEEKQRVADLLTQQEENGF